MANRAPILLRPHWIINNQFTLPLVMIDDNGKTSIRGLIQIFLPVTIFLDTLFSDSQGFTSRYVVKVPSIPSSTQIYFYF